MADNNLSLLEKLEKGSNESKRIEKTTGIMSGDQWYYATHLKQIYETYNNVRLTDEQAEKYLNKNENNINFYYSKIKEGIPTNQKPMSKEEEELLRYYSGGKRISKGKSNKVAKKPVVSQKKQSVYKEIFGKQMKIYKMPDSRKEYVKYKGELHPISEYKSLMKQKALAKPKAKK